MESSRMSSGNVVSHNLPPPLADFDAWQSDALLRAAVAREGADWIEARAVPLGRLVGSVAFQEWATQANTHPPVLQAYDRNGDRIDVVDYHPAYHQLMQAAFGAGLHSLAWKETREGRYVARAALNYLWNQGEQGTACPVTMTFASVQVLRNAPDLAAQWEAKILADDYDPRSLPLAHKRAATIGMAMTEKQGGSDLRSNAAVAIPVSGDEHVLLGHKWFCSAPMSDGFLTLAQRSEGPTCLFVPRILPDGTRNSLRIVRLKDKLGNRSNASAEIEYERTHAWLVGEPGRGIGTLIEMAHLTRFDIVIAVAGMMRAALRQVLHHTRHRAAFGAPLIEQPLMRNVLADLALETEAAMLLAFRLAGAFDRAAQDERARIYARVVTPAAKYWLCKRLPMLAAEALECLGGNGYVEDWPMARFYREAPLNGVWEGSGNVICLDVLRALAKTPGALDMLDVELAQAARHPAIARHLGLLHRAVHEEPAGGEARRLTEGLALCLQAALLLEHAPPAVAEAFIAARLGGQGGLAFGTLPAETDCAAIIARHREA
ncbi:MAG TPA: acyl-CoA dehydrogenase family protein [Burkholderiales bacterium]|nr:acyl-CoA dehydrogenase family protein [Burkholderiales bacterium]